MMLRILSTSTRQKVRIRMTKEEAIDIIKCLAWHARPNEEDIEQAIEALKTQPSEDCISRKAVLDGLASIAKAKAKSDVQKSLMGRVMFFTEHLPSATPQPKERTEERTEMHEKTGHWEWVQYESKPNFGNWHCSECRCILRGEIKENPIRLPKYCPECGCRMQEVKK